MFPNTIHRTTLPEIMDDFALKGETLRDALDKIAKINQLLGGNKINIAALRRFFSKADLSKTISICDIGCGNGDMLRVIADYARNHGIRIALIGIDANQYTIEYAQKCSSHYPNITYYCEDVFGESFGRRRFDIVLCTLTLHHFSDSDILSLMRSFCSQVNMGIIINDLQRSGLSYRLFQMLCFVFRLNKMSREDGLVSILRGFKRMELIDFSEKLNFKKYSIQWKWAFRYQWIITKI